MKAILLILIWPGGAIGCLALSLLGHLKRRANLAALGSVLGFPFLLYLAATPRFGLWAWAVIVTNLASVVALGTGRPRLALVLFSPFPVFLAIFASFVLTR